MVARPAGDAPEPPAGAPDRSREREGRRPSAPAGGPAPGAARWGTGPLLFAADLVAVAVAVAGLEVVGRAVGPDSPAGELTAFGGVLLALVWSAGLYRSRLSLSVLDDLPAVTGRWLAAVTVTVLGQVAWSGAMWQDVVVDRQFLWGTLAALVAVVGLRAAGYAAVRRARSRRRLVRRTLVVGAGRVGQQVADILLAHPEYGLQPVGFVDADPLVRTGGAVPVLGGPRSLATLLTDHGIGAVVVAFSSVAESEVVGLVRTCDRNGCELFVVPRLFEVQHVQVGMDTAWGLPLVRLRRVTRHGGARRVKRAVDVLVAGSALVAIAPLLLVLAVAVRLDGGPGVLVRRERVGADGRHVEVLAFRSLRPATDAGSGCDTAQGDRPTPLGRFLRASALEELPQLLTVLRGDMSLVGPRPRHPSVVRESRATHPSDGARRRVPSGLTGWAQVHGLRGDTSPADRARFDAYYVENWSLWLDVKIMARTVGSVLRGAGR